MTFKDSTASWNSSRNEDENRVGTKRKQVSTVFFPGTIFVTSVTRPSHILSYSKEVLSELKNNPNSISGSMRKSISESLGRC